MVAFVEGAQQKVSENEVNKTGVKKGRKHYKCINEAFVYVCLCMHACMYVTTVPTELQHRTLHPMNKMTGRCMCQTPESFIMIPV